MPSEKEPIITIITATYNSVSVLERCIQGVISQTYKNIEFIIIDGNSKDETVAIIKKYSNHIFKWISEPDKGVYDAWNKGIDLATGSWITFIGSDDLLYPDAIQNYVEHINKSNVNFDFISSRVHVVNKHDNVIRTLGWPWRWETSRRENNIIINMIPVTKLLVIMN